MSNVRYQYLKQVLAEYDVAFSAFDHTDEARANVDEAYKRLGVGIIPNLHALVDLAEAALAIRDYQNSIGGHVIPNTREVEHLMGLHEKYLEALKALDSDQH